MTVALLHSPARNGLILSAEKLARWLIAISVFAGAFVMEEPAPYELLMLFTMAAFLLFGLRLSVHALALAAMLGVFCFGGLLSMLTMDSYRDVPIYLSVTAFLGLSSVFFCAVIETEPKRLKTIFRAYLAGAVITAILGIAGYFHAFAGAEIFTRYDRAMGTFQDPNVFGPFLVLPALYLFQTLLTGNKSLVLPGLLALGVLLVALLLSFSRGAWGLLIVSMALAYFINLVTAPDESSRKKLSSLGLLASGLLVAALATALQFEAIADMFELRAKWVQEYDGAQLGRFARHAIGFAWAIEHPLGIGALEFGLKLGEDTHNIWLKSLMAYGWLGFAALITLTVLTLVLGGRCLGRVRVWQPYLICAYSAYVGHLLVGWVIDIDHWRHFYLIVGLIWGCIALEARHQDEQANRI